MGRVCRPAPRSTSSPENASEADPDRAAAAMSGRTHRRRHVAATVRMTPVPDVTSRYRPHVTRVVPDDTDPVDRAMAAVIPHKIPLGVDWSSTRVVAADEDHPFVLAMMMAVVLRFRRRNGSEHGGRCDQTGDDVVFHMFSLRWGCAGFDGPDREIFNGNGRPLPDENRTRTHPVRGTPTSHDAARGDETGDQPVASDHDSTDSPVRAQSGESDRAGHEAHMHRAPASASSERSPLVRAMWATNGWPARRLRV